MTHKAKLENEMNLKVIIAIEIFSSLTGMVLAIVLANLGFGVYSLIFHTLTTISISTICLLKVSGFSLSFRMKNIRHSDKSGVIGFSGYFLSFNLINYFSRNLDSMLIGRFLSSAMLGV